VVTFTDSTKDQDFAGAGADRVLADLSGATLADLLGF
jgi:hypothetical protein